MTYLMFLFAGLAFAICAGLVVLANRLLDSYDHDGLGFLAGLIGILVGVGGLMLLVGAIITPIQAGYDKRQCYRYGSLTQREVKYQRFSYWTWDCYVRTGSGNWITKDQVRGVDQ